MANQIFDLTIIEEFRDELPEVEHNHFEKCPACGREYAGTSMWCEPGDYMKDEKPFYCQACGQCFLLLEYDCGDAKVELLDRIKIDPANPPSIFTTLTYDRDRHNEILANLQTPSSEPEKH